MSSTLERKRADSSNRIEENVSESFLEILHDSVKLRRRGALALLLLDGVHEARAQLPPRFIQLDIKWGLFAGGLGDFQDLFLGHLQSFRGCMADVMFNEVELFETAAASSVGVVWGECSEEFSASVDQPFSLVEADAYLALPKMNARTGGSLAVEGNGVVTLRSEASVNDGRWHQLGLQFGSSHVELSVDGSVESLRTGLGRNQFFDLSGPLFLGRPRRVSAVASRAGARPAVGDVAARLSTTRTRQRRSHRSSRRPRHQRSQARLRLGVPVPSGPVRARAPAASRRVPTASSASAMPPPPMAAVGGWTALGLTSPVPTRCTRRLSTSCLHCLRCEWPEGGSDLVTTEHIRLLVDHRDLGVSDTGVLFHVMDAPKHGALEIEVWHRGTPDNVFTLADLSTQKVRYTHDGSENHRDSAVFELEFRSRTFDLPAVLKERKRFVLHVIVSPVNDAPQGQGACAVSRWRFFFLPSLYLWIVISRASGVNASSPRPPHTPPFPFRAIFNESDAAMHPSAHIKVESGTFLLATKTTNIVVSLP
ncbi:hypothetical protein MRX96_014145 [Rhipicephalus microplus]